MITVIERLNIIKERYTWLNTQLLEPEILKDVNRTRELSKEMSDLEDTVICYDKYNKVITDIEAANEMLKDADMAEFAKEELTALELEKETLIHTLEIHLIPKDPNDGKNVIVEIRGAAGGDEANIFAGDLYRMYLKLAERNSWKIEVISEEYSDGGGFSLISFMIKGKNVYANLKYESGAHRVQRVPVTETQGRIHTSTATVLVMPEVEEVNVEVKETDLKIDVYRSGGAGGQSVNTTDSAVRMTHVPTGIVVTCQNERSQIQNREKALQLLKIKIHEETIRKHEEEVGNERKSKIGTGDRSEKVRTYNYPQNRVTDHRIGFTSMNLDRVMEGDIVEVIEALITEEQRRQLEGN